MAAQAELAASSTHGLVRDVEALMGRLVAAARRAELGERELGLLEAARRLYEGRRLREEIFGECIAPDPSWDLLLTLLIAKLEDRKVTVSAACAAAAAPATTALRHLDQLVRLGLVCREANPRDARSCFVVLTGEAERKLVEFFSRSADDAARKEP